MPGHRLTENPGKKKGAEDPRRFARLLLFASFLKERAEAVGAPFAEKELDISGSNQAESCKQVEIDRLRKKPVLGKDDHEYYRDFTPGLVPEGIGPFRTARENPGESARDDMPAVRVPAGTFRAERIDNDEARKEYPNKI